MKLKMLLANSSAISGQAYSGLYTDFYTNIIAGIVILFIGFIVGKLAGKLVFRILRELEANAIFKKAILIDRPVEYLAKQAVQYFIYFITIIMVLNQLGITTTVLQMIIAAIIIIFAASAVLAARDFLPNFFAWLRIYRNDYIKEGDFIEVKGIKGRVARISLLETRLEAKGGDIVYIPNSSFMQSEIKKLKKGWRKKAKRQ